MKKEEMRERKIMSEYDVFSIRYVVWLATTWFLVGLGVGLMIGSNLW
jgi:hypothetical protein